MGEWSFDNATFYETGKNQSYKFYGRQRRSMRTIGQQDGKNRLGPEEMPLLHTCRGQGCDVYVSR